MNDARAHRLPFADGAVHLSVDCSYRKRFMRCSVYLLETIKYKKHSFSARKAFCWNLCIKNKDKSGEKQAGMSYMLALLIWNEGAKLVTRTNYPLCACTPSINKFGAGSDFPTVHVPSTTESVFSLQLGIRSTKWLTNSTVLVCFEELRLRKRGRCWASTVLVAWPLAGRIMMNNAPAS